MDNSNKKKSSGRISAFFISNRRKIQIVTAAAVFVALNYFGISLWWLLAAGVLTGIIFGKVFCRWICPMGLIMELITGAGGENGKFQSMYQYHKLGCPIAWISGILNRFSLFKVRLDENACKECGLCDKACYLSTLNSDKFSLFKKDKTRPDTAFACSKCLACVEACPADSLSYKPAK